MKNISKYLLLICMAISFTNCHREADLQNVKYVDNNQIKKIELSLNSPVLDADGKAELKFSVKCKYEYEGKLYDMLAERVPVDKIKIYSDTGKEFALGNTFSTNTVPTSGKINFYCKLGNLKSNDVSVKVLQPVEENYTPIVIPVQVYALYSEKNTSYTKGITEENFDKLLGRMNQVLAGKLANAPSSCDAKISFKLVNIQTIKKSLDTYDVADYIKENLMDSAHQNFTIWITESRPNNLSSEECIPAFTTGSKEDIPGVELEAVNDENEAIDIISKGYGSSITKAGLVLTYSEFYSMLNKTSSESFELTLGRCYGLLETGAIESQINDDVTNGDLDFCPDTFSYILKQLIIEKKVFVPKDTIEAVGEENIIYNYYDSYNIMDQNSTSKVISREQIKRMRQVIQDCPFRQMQL